MTDREARRHTRAEQVIEDVRADLVDTATERTERRAHPQAWWIDRPAERRRRS